jgi:hypothetical protein
MPLIGRRRGENMQKIFTPSELRTIRKIHQLAKPFPPKQRRMMEDLLSDILAEFRRSQFRPTSGQLRKKKRVKPNG